MTDSPRSHHSQTAIDNRRNSHPRHREPDDLHDYLPSRQPDNDNCSVCGREWAASVAGAAVHIPIGPEDPGEV